MARHWRTVWHKDAHASVARLLRPGVSVINNRGVVQLNRIHLSNEPCGTVAQVRSDHMEHRRCEFFSENDLDEEGLEGGVCVGAPLSVIVKSDRLAGNRTPELGMGCGADKGVPR